MALFLAFLIGIASSAGFFTPVGGASVVTPLDGSTGGIGGGG